LKKNYVQYKKSHGTDWVFVILLLIIVLTGIAQHVFHRTGLFELANITYVIHLMSVVPWLLRMPSANGHTLSIVHWLCICSHPKGCFSPAGNSFTNLPGFNKVTKGINE